MAKILDDADKFCYIKLTDKDKPDFDCTDRKGKDSHGLQEFIKKRALKNHKAHLGTTYIITYEKKPIGYIAVATSNIHKNKILSKKRPSTRDGSLYPALIILDFCIDKKQRNKKHGEQALLWFSGLARIISESVGCRYIILYTKDPSAIKFYEKHKYRIAEESTKNRFKMMYLDIFPELRK